MTTGRGWASRQGRGPRGARQQIKLLQSSSSSRGDRARGAAGAQGQGDHRRPEGEPAVGTRRLLELPARSTPSSTGRRFGREKGRRAVRGEAGIRDHGAPCARDALADRFAYSGCVGVRWWSGWEGGTRVQCAATTHTHPPLACAGAANTSPLHSARTCSQSGVGAKC
ncbi:hypothetical protein NDU88_006578 [Pleurodeles waltl]|uniref:Uncharacterized protein n=1 Tax=Pleurodeles waltl TaxID=8319 RepID=A0AAV7MCM5_PLEWA|nr:hypothetical protein NDU88_006578 [Pleurodeles waltl]